MVQHKTAKTISDMISSMELQRLRVTPILQQCDLAIALEALSKPPYEPLWEVSLEHLTLRSIFLLAIASAKRCSELQVLVFDQRHIQLKPKGAGVALYFSPEFMRKNQKPNHVNDRWYIPVVLLQVRVWHSYCPVRALHYYYGYLAEPPELRKGRRHLFVPIQDNNGGIELSEATISAGSA